MGTMHTKSMSDLWWRGWRLSKFRFSLHYLNGHDLSGGLVGYISTLKLRHAV